MFLKETSRISQNMEEATRQQVLGSEEVKPLIRPQLDSLYSFLSSVEEEIL